MNIYLISQSKNTGYDTFDSAVVAAPDALEASTIHPSGSKREGLWSSHWSMTWVSRPIDVNVKCLGMANPGTEAGVICASFNAG